MQAFAIYIRVGTKLQVTLVAFLIQRSTDAGRRIGGYLGLGDRFPAATKAQ
jgi:hypothetical protein